MQDLVASIQAPRTAGRARQGGFTVIELMTVVLLVAVLAVLAAPGFQTLIATQRVKSVASALNESLWVARSEALKRNDKVSFSFINSGDNSPVADWKITQSSDGSGTAILQQSGSPTVLSSTTGGGNLLFTFNSSGRLSSGGSTFIKLSVPSANVNRWVCISPNGRAVTQTTSCS